MIITISKLNVILIKRTIYNHDRIQLVNFSTELLSDIKENPNQRKAEHFLYTIHFDEFSLNSFCFLIRE